MRLLGTFAVTLTLAAVGCSTVEPPVDVPPEPQPVQTQALDLELDFRPVEREFVQRAAPSKRPADLESHEHGVESDFAHPETTASPEDFLGGSVSDEEREENLVESEHIPPTP